MVVDALVVLSSCIYTVMDARLVLESSIVHQPSSNKLFAIFGSFTSKKKVTDYTISRMEKKAVTFLPVKKQRLFCEL